MYETVKQRFPHLSDTDRIEIAQFALDYSKLESDSIFEKLKKIFE